MSAADICSWAGLCTRGSPHERARLSQRTTLEDIHGPAFRDHSLWRKARADRAAATSAIPDKPKGKTKPKAGQNLTLRVSSHLANIKLSKSGTKPGTDWTDLQHDTKIQSCWYQNPCCTQMKMKYSTFSFPAAEKINFLTVAVQEHAQVCMDLSVSHTSSNLLRRLKWKICHVGQSFDIVSLTSGPSYSGLGCWHTGSQPEYKLIHWNLR